MGGKRTNGEQNVNATILYTTATHLKTTRYLSTMWDGTHHLTH